MYHHVDAHVRGAIKELMAEEDPERVAEVDERPVPTPDLGTGRATWATDD